VVQSVFGYFVSLKLLLLLLLFIFCFCLDFDLHFRCTLRFGAVAMFMFRTLLCRSRFLFFYCFFFVCSLLLFGWFDYCLSAFKFVIC